MTLITTVSKPLALIVLCAAPLVFTACGGRKVKTAKPARIGASQTGIASWYGNPYHGRRAANGEVYDMEKLTAAHRTLPFETWVRVRNVTNNKTVEVRIQDRGPFVGKRIIDLSRAAARQIDLLGPGTAKVKLTVIKPPSKRDQQRREPTETTSQQQPAASPAPAPPPVTLVEPRRQQELYAVQVGAFRDKTRAEAVRDAMRARYGTARIVERAADRVIYRVLVGSEEEEAKAAALAEQIRAGGDTALVVRVDLP